jgi:hypothetical protein
MALLKKKLVRRWWGKKEVEGNTISQPKRALAMAEK